MRDRYSHRSASTARTKTAMNAIGMKPTLFVSPLITSLLIVPSGWSRSQSDAPSRMLRVPSVAMIDGQPEDPDQDRVEDAGREPDAEERERAREVPRSPTSSASA